MNITDIKITRVKSQEKNRLRAFVSIVIDNAFRVTDIKIIEGDSGFFLSMPSKRRNDGTYRDIAHPVNQDARDVLEKGVLSAFEAKLAEEDEKLDLTNEGDSVENLAEPKTDDPLSVSEFGF